MASRPPTMPSGRPPSGNSGRPPSNRPPGGGIPGAGVGNGNNSTPPVDTTPTTPTPDPIPPTPAPIMGSSIMGRSALSVPVKAATPDIILFEDEIQPVEEIADLIFQQIGGRELINLTNKDIINSINPDVGVINNMFKINLQYNFQNLVPLFNPSNEIMNSYSIKLNDYVPEPGEGTGPGGSSVYINEDGDLVIDLINLVNNEKIEIQILNGGTVFNDTIYAEENT